MKQKAYIIDTHALIWFLINQDKLGNNARKILLVQKPDFLLIIPVIVLVEMKYLIAKGKININLNQAHYDLNSESYVEFAQFDDYMISFVSDKLNIHDSMIVATALFYRDFIGFDVSMITKDSEIIKSKLVDVIW